MRQNFQQSRWLHCALAWLTWSAVQAWAQSPALSSDSWVRFPPRPAAPALPTETALSPVPEPAATPAPTPAPRVKPKTKSAEAQAAAQAAPAPVAPVAPTQDAWIRFPLAPSRSSPAVAMPATPPASPEPNLRLVTPGAGPTVANTAPVTTPVSGASPKKRQIVDFTITGNERVETSELLEALSAQRGQSLNNDTLRQTTDIVSEVYQRKGILALVEMPEQDLTLGVPNIKVTEAKFAGLVVEDPKGQLANNAQLPVAMVERIQPKGELVSLPALDQASLMMNEIPGVDIKMSLRPGDQPGQTQAVALVDKGKPLEGSVTVDDAGAKATGELRESVRLTVNNPLKMGDSATVQLMHSKGMDYQRASYSVPVGAAGWRVGVNTSNSRYSVVTSEFEYLRARGPAHTGGIDLTIPLQRNLQNNLTLQLAADRRRYRNEALDVLQSDYRGSTVSAYLEGTHREGTQAETTASVQWVSGNIDLSGSTAAHQFGDASTTRTEGAYNKVRLALMHRQDLDAFNTVMASAQSQWASKNLDSSEKLFLGGANGVRAYPTNEAGGSLGQLLSLEWQRHFNWEQRRVTAAGFYDTGRITLNKNNDFTGAPAVNSYSLSGAGLWIGTSIPNRYGVTTLRLTAAHRLGNNEGALAPSGLDQDGTRVLNRYRFNLTQSF